MAWRRTPRTTTVSIFRPRPGACKALPALQALDSVWRGLLAAGPIDSAATPTASEPTVLRRTTLHPAADSRADPDSHCRPNPSGRFGPDRLWAGEAEGRRISISRGCTCSTWLPAKRDRSSARISNSNPPRRTENTSLSAREHPFTAPTWMGHFRSN